MTCIKKKFSKHQADTFKKGEFMSRITKKKVRKYLCDECFSYHLTTNSNNNDFVKDENL